MKRKLIITSLIILIGSFIYSTSIVMINEFSPLRKQIFLPRKTSVYPKISHDIRLKVKNKNRIVNGVFTKNSDKLVVLFHGNGAIINDMEFLTKTFYRNGKVPKFKYSLYFCCW